MNTKVEDYKGFEIYFNSDNGKFSVEGGDKEKSSKSFDACKKWINDFIKENVIFGEFEIVKLPNNRNSDYAEPNKALVKGLSSSGNFLCEYEDGSKFQLNPRYDYEIKKWYLPKDLEKSLYKQEKVDKWRKEIEHFRGQINEEYEKLPKDIMEVLQKLKGEFKSIWAG